MAQKYLFTTRRLFSNILSYRSLSSSLSPDLFETAISEANLRATIERMQKFNLGSKKSSTATTGKKKNGTASVFIPFCHDPHTGKPSILLTRRSYALSNHRGEVCFPGGFAEAVDGGSPEEVAIRETLEELGSVRREDIIVYGAMPSIQFNAFPLTPVIGTISLDASRWPLAVNTEEVESVHLVPLEALVKPENWRKTVFSHGWTTPVFLDISEPKVHPRVWGMTSSLLYVTMASLMPEVFHFDFEYLWRSRTKTRTTDAAGWKV